MVRDAKPRRDYFVFIPAFALLCAVVFSPFVLANKSFVWIGDTHDGLCQHYATLVYEGIWLRDIAKSILSGAPEVRLWDFSIGLGSDVLTTFSYYGLGDPLNILSAVVPSRYTEYLYSALIILRLLLAGCAFILYCHTMGYQGTKVVTGALAYSFCSFALNAAVRHPFFVIPLVYLPMLLVGIERIYRERRPSLYIAMIFLSAISNFYFFYMLAISVALYAFIRFFTLPHKHPARELVGYGATFVFCALIGIACAAVLLVPTIATLLSSDRANSKPVIERWYELDYYLGLVADFFKPAGVTGRWRCLGFLAPVLVGLCYLLARPRKHPILATTLVVMVGILLVPFCGSVLNGFSYASNRWIFAFAFFGTITLVAVWDELVQIAPSDFKALAISSAVVAALALVGIPRLHQLGAYLQLMAFAITLLVISRGKRAKVGRRARAHAASNRNQVFVSRALATLVVVGIACNSLYLYSPKGSGYIEQFLTRGLAYRAITETPYRSIETYVEQEGTGSTGIVRVESDSFTKELDSDDKLYFNNASMFTDLSSTQYFWSLTEAKTTEYINDLELGDAMSFRATYLEKRAMPIALASVSYEYITGFAPYGFEKTSASHIMKAETPLSIGYTYQSVLPRSEYEALDVTRRQQAAMQAAIVDDSVASSRAEGIELCEPSFTEVIVPYETSFVGDITKTGEGEYLCGEGSQIVLDFEGLDACETYLRIKGLQTEVMSDQDMLEAKGASLASETMANMSLFDRLHLVYMDKKASNWLRNKYPFDITGYLDDGKRIDRYLKHRSPNNPYYDGRHDYLVSMYYHENALTRIVITIPAQGRYRFESIDVVCQPMDDFEEQVAALGAHELRDVHVATNALSGSVDLDSAGILTIAVPNARGWTAEVDGEPIETFDVNTAFIGMMLEAGEHTVRLRYRTYLLREGMVISLVGLALAIVVWRIERRRVE